MIGDLGRGVSSGPAGGHGHQGHVDLAGDAGDEAALLDSASADHGGALALVVHVLLIGQARRADAPRPERDGLVQLDDSYVRIETFRHVEVRMARQSLNLAFQRLLRFVFDIVCS